MYREPDGLGDPKPDKTPKKKYRRIRPFSGKRKERYEVYKKLREIHLGENPICQCCKLAKGTDVHHKAGRSGEMLNKMYYWLVVCRPCHIWIEKNPYEALEKGYSLPRLS